MWCKCDADCKSAFGSSQCGYACIDHKCKQQDNAKLCEDKNECTEDVCTNGVCLFPNKPKNTDCETDRCSEDADDDDEFKKRTFDRSRCRG